MSLIEAYFDESGSHDGSPVLCVAGFILHSDLLPVFNNRWNAMLKRYDLEYFRMSSCAHGTDRFHLLSKAECLAVEVEAIKIIRDVIEFGIAISIIPKEFERIVPVNKITGSAYSLCAHTCLATVRQWYKEVGYKGDVTYFSESGHRSQAEANQIMTRLFKLPIDRQYVSHTFADKKKICPLQAADIIAWQWHTEKKRIIERKRPKPRDDLQALIAPMDTGAHYKTFHFEPRHLASVSESPLRNEYPLTYPEIL